MFLYIQWLDMITLVQKSKIGIKFHIRQKEKKTDMLIIVVKAS